MNTTVVISNFNYPHYVRCAIESCVKQTIPCHIIVVDDCSNDSSWDVIKSCKEEFSDASMEIIRLGSNSGGNARGKNVGISLCNTEYVICLDSDDALLPDSIEIRLPHFSSNIDWVHGRALRMRSYGPYYKLMQKANKDNRNTLIAKEMYKKHILALPENHIKWYKGVEASTVMARKSCYSTVGLYDENLKWKIDREMWYRFLTHDVRKKYIKDPVSIYRNHPDQVTKNRSRKNPVKVNKMFDEIIEKRKILTPENTIMLNTYNPNKYIDKRI